MGSHLPSSDARAPVLHRIVFAGPNFALRHYSWLIKFLQCNRPSNQFLALMNFARNCAKWTT
jgi:hypothetical protein